MKSTSTAAEIKQVATLIESHAYRSSRSAVRGLLKLTGGRGPSDQRVAAAAQRLVRLDEPHSVF